MNKSVIGICSGYFNPIHRGHIEYLCKASECCDKLWVIVNSDRQVKLKGSVPFMDEEHRLYIVKSLACLMFNGNAMISIDEDKSVCNTIRQIRSYCPEHPIIFFNSGDRKGGNLESSERVLCRELNIEYQILDLPKVASSSDLIKNALANHNI